MIPNLYANGQNVRALGLVVTTLTGPWDAIAITDPTLAVPGRRGVMRTGEPPTSPVRQIVIGGTVIETNLTRTHADLLAKLDTLKALFALGAIELVLADRLGFAFMAERVDFKVVMDGPALVATTATVTITLQALDPALYELEPQCLGFGAVAVPIPLGTAPSDALIRISGPFTNPVVTYRDCTGTVLHTIGLTRSAADTTIYEEIDAGAQLITKYASGVASDDSAAVTSGDLEDFALSPADGDALSGLSPTIEVSGLAAGGWAEVCYRRSYQ